MRYLRSHPRLCWLARVLALVMLSPYLLWAGPASAQRSIPSVYVLDFNNKTTIGGQLLGRVAAAQVSLQLSESQNWDVVPDAQVQRRIQELNIKQPFDRVNRVQIANGIDATAAIYGTITDARVTTGAAPQAFVRMQVLVEDIQTSVLINGAIVEGLSTPRMGYNGDADVLLEEALGKAAFKAREFMDRFRLPEGTVLNTTVVGTPEQPQLDALINFGARQGVRRGMTMIVTRSLQPVGTLRVTSVDSDISTGRVITNVQGVKPEDRVRAIFNFSDFPVTRARLKAAAPSNNAGLVASNEVDVSEPGGGAPTPLAKPAVVGVVGKSGTFAQFRSPNESSRQVAQNAVQAPPPVVVDEPEVEGSAEGARGGHRRILGAGPLRTLVGGLLVFGILAVAGRGGKNAARPIGVDARGFQTAPGAPGAFIKVVWDRPKAVKSSDVLGYVIWRSDPLNFTPIIVGGLDGDTTLEFLDNESTRDVTAYNGTPGSTDAGTRTTIMSVPGIIPGTEYRYQISTAYHNQLQVTDDQGGTDGSGGTGTGTGGGNGGGTSSMFTDVMSALSESSGWATAIAPPTIIAVNGETPSADQQVDLRNITIDWQQTPGANTYFVWMSPDPTFPSSKRVVFGPFQTLPTDQGGPSIISRTMPNANKEGLRKRRIYISVGGRNSQDALNPVPFGAIFSAPAQVRPEQGPPGPPGQGGNARPAGQGNHNGTGGGKPRGGRNGGGAGRNQ